MPDKKDDAVEETVSEVLTDPDSPANEPGPDTPQTIETEDEDGPIGHRGG